MAARLAEALDIEPSAVSVKAKSNEGLDAIGRGEAVAVHAVAMVSCTGSDW
jgi:2C-methyl-D-erythritol 2,4-cyclodiphosphate synthase